MNATQNPALRVLLYVAAGIGMSALLAGERASARRACQGASGCGTLHRAQAQLEAAIAERTRALAQREQLYRTVADLSPQIIWMIDPAGDTVYLNRAWYATMGPREGGWLGQRWLDAMHPDDRAATAAHIRAALQGDRPFNTRFRLRDARGLYHACLSSGAAVRGPEGRLEGWVGVCTDVTELELRERELRALNDELASFSYTLSHDLRGPAQVMKALLEALIDGEVGHADDAARDYLRRLRRNAGRIEDVIDDVLMLSHLSRETAHPGPLDLAALAGVAMETVRERFPDRAVVFRSPPSLAAVADPRLMRLMLENLFDNAVKFSRGEEADVDFSGWREGDGLVLRVADRGVGFPADMADRLFQPFRRLHTDAEFQGTGVGLATVARIARVHHGRVAAYPREGGGSVFEVRLQDQPQGTADAPASGAGVTQAC